MSALDLSICITTLNRGALFAETLETILPQLTSSCELVVVDGGSTDETEAIVTRLAARDPRVHYHRQSENGGVDRDYAAAVEYSRGRYCWLFTDDDLMLPGALDAVLRAMASNPALVLVNADVWNVDFTRCCDPNRLRMSEDRRYEVGEDDRFLADTGRYLTFIGGVVVRRDVWDAREKERYFGSLFIHVGVLFQAPLPAHVEVIAKPGIRIRYGNAGWTPRAFEIWMFKWPDLVWSMPRAAEAKARVTAREPWRNPLMLGVHRACGSYSVTEYDRWLRPRARGLARLMAALIARIPFRPFNALLRFAGVIFGLSHRTTGVDLRNAIRRRR